MGVADANDGHDGCCSLWHAPSSSSDASRRHGQCQPAEQAREAEDKEDEQEEDQEGEDQEREADKGG